VFASGSPYKPYEFEGKVYEPGQGNNMYIFPGIGMGAILSKAKHVTDSMVEQASIALAGSLTADETASELVYPRLTRIRDISAQIALAVIRAAQKEVSIETRDSCNVANISLLHPIQNVDENTLFRNLSDDALLEYIKGKQWQPTNTYSLPRL